MENYRRIMNIKEVIKLIPAFVNDLNRCDNSKFDVIKAPIKKINK